MPLSRVRLRKTLAWLHLWLGVAGGVFVCLMCVSGALVALRPPLAAWMSPRPEQGGGCATPVDWARAEHEVTSFARAPINRIYAFGPDNSLVHFRTSTPDRIIFGHVIYDACAGHVLGALNLGWMDWLVDLHHNLLAGNRGRWWAGVIGVALFVSTLAGFGVWLLGSPRLLTAFRVSRVGSPVQVSRGLHRALGLGVGCVLLLEAYTSLWLCFPQLMRQSLSVVASVPDEARVTRLKPAPGAVPAGLAAVMASAQQAMPDGDVREIRMPDGVGNVQVRMWRAGDFRSLGNNVVTVENVGATVVGVNGYRDKPAASRFVQAVAALHYGEWGGTTARLIYAAAGFATLLLFASGLLMWRGLPVRHRRKAHATSGASVGAVAVSD